MDNVYKRLELSAEESVKVATEVMFEVATARAEGVELMRFSLKAKEDARIVSRLSRAAKKVLKDMKGRGAIQFFAFPESMENKSMEYEFIVNKYSGLLDLSADGVEGEEYFYVKL